MPLLLEQCLVLPSRRFVMASTSRNLANCCPANAGLNSVPMIEPNSETPLPQTPENYRELQAMVNYADPLFIGRNGAWIGSQAVLLAIAVAQFEHVPAAMLLTLAATGVLISVFWLLIVKSLGDRIRWLDHELCKYEGSIHARYLSNHRSMVSRPWTIHIMIFAFPATFAGAWILLAVIKCAS